MSQVYPWDRGTNYAIEIGQRAAKQIMGAANGRMIVLTVIVPCATIRSASWIYLGGFGMTLGLRRLLLVVLSILGGIGLVFVMFWLLNAFFPTADITLDRYGMEYFVLSALPLALLVGLWLNYFMRTGLIPETSKQPAAKKGAARPAAAAPAEAAAEE